MSHLPALPCQPENHTDLSGRSKEKVSVWTILLIVAIISLMVLLFVYREQVQKLEKFGYLGSFLISVAANATIIIPVPGLAITTTMGAIFNPLGVAIASGLGAAIGELTGYAVGKSGSNFVSDKNFYQRLLDWMTRHPKRAFWIIVLMAFVPNPLMDVTGMACGALGIPAWKYLLGCAIGKTLKMLVFAYAGHYSWRLFSSQP